VDPGVDPNTGLQYDQARYYDPTTDEFLTTDPLQALTGQPYSYAADNPVNATDPTGEISLDQVLGIAATVSLAVVTDGGSLAVEEAGAAVEGGLDVSEAAEAGTDTVDAGDGAEDAPDSEPSCGATEDTGGALSGIRNGQLAGDAHPTTGVPFDENGYPDFSNWSHPDVPDVTIEPTGTRAGDYTAANQAAGLDSTPEGYTWHHNQEPRCHAAG
jgi:uncharacterized protein RhaS with RHS repeats